MTQTTTSNISNLFLLTVLAQTRSYTLAAKRLAISKATMSQRIGELERTAGVPLVRRTTRSVSLTQAGQQLVEETRGAFSQISQSFSTVKDLVGMPRGLVRVTAPVALGRQRVAPTLAKFLKSFPEVRIELDLSDRIVNLAQDGFDLAIRHADSPPDTHVAWELCKTRSMLVAAPEYLRRRGTPDHPSELTNHTCLLYLRDTASQNWFFSRELRRGKLEHVTVTVNGNLKANNSEVLREAVLGGVGIALLPDFSAAEYLGPRRLLEICPSWIPERFFGQRIYAIRPWAPQVPRAVKCFVDYLRGALAVAS